MGEKRAKIQQSATECIVKNNWCGVYILSPRFGKSKVFIDSIKDKGNRNIAITAPYNSILESWKVEFVKWGLEFEPLLLNQRSLEELPENIDLLCLDEIHTLSPAQIQTIKRKSPKRILGLSGTISQKNRIKLKQELGLKVELEFSIEQAIEHNIISDYEIFIKEVILTPEERTAYNKLTKTFEYFKMLSFSDPKYVHVKNNAALKRAQYIYRLESKLKAAQSLIKPLKRVLVFTTLTEVADKLCKHSYHSKSKEDSLELFQKKKVNKLSCIGMLSMG